MNGESKSVAGDASRREFLKSSGVALAAGALGTSLGIARQAHAAANDDTIRVALIGCGGRGTGAAFGALATKGNVKLVAMADAFADRIESSLKELTKDEGNAARVDVPPDRRFVGFDAFQQVIDSGVDLVILATPPGFRPQHYEAAIKANKHVFMEKPLATDAPGVRKILEVNEDAKKKKLAVGVGLQRHHQAGYLEAIKRLQDGAVGEMICARVYWNGVRPWRHSRSEVAQMLNKPVAELTEMEYQMRNWYQFVWLSGDHIVEQHIHNMDVINWVRDDHPVRAVGMGGAQYYRGPDDGEIFDHHAVEFIYDDGSRMLSQCRQIPNCWGQVSENIHGTRGTATLNADANRFEFQVREGEGWKFAGPKGNPYQVEHDDLFAAIRAGTPYNEADSGARSTMTAILGRMATYSGKEVHWDQASASNLSVMPTEYTWTAKTPTVPGADGLYSHATPGVTRVV